MTSFFSFMSERSHRFPDINQYNEELNKINVFCLRTQPIAQKGFELRTPDFESDALQHWSSMSYFHMAVTKVKGKRQRLMATSSNCHNGNLKPDEQMLFDLQLL